MDDKTHVLTKYIWYSQEEKLVEFIRETDIVNPTEFARGILSQVLKSSGGMPMDDMTVLVIGIWGLS